MAAPKHLQIVGLCLLATSFIGIGCLVGMSQLDTTLPVFQLDAVLTSEELADKAFRDRTFEILQQAGPGHARAWYLTGAVLIAISGVGLWAIFKEIKRQEAQRSGP